MTSELVEKIVSLESSEILIAEFNYAAQATLVANEERAKVTSYYFVTVGSFIAAALSLKLDANNNMHIYIVFALLFGTLSLLSILLQLHLVRLRLAWFDGIAAMNQIKEYFVTHSTLNDLDKALRWSNKCRPATHKFNSISFLMSLQVAFLGGLLLGASCLFVGLLQGMWWFALAIILGLVYFLLQIYMYRKLLKNLD